MGEDPRIGAVLGGKYRLDAVLGRGGFGAVFQATNAELERRVAVKVIEPQWVWHPEVVARFRNEARAASRVESEHIVQVFDVGNDETHGLYMVMELLQGEDLAARLDRELKLNPVLAVHIALQACRGLARAHAAGVVHRDLKPANVFLVTREDGSLHVKLVDFGISKMLFPDPKNDVALTIAGTAVGTPNYMSPEQARGEAVDGRTDVWSLGALLFEMLSGTPAYPHELTYQQTVIAIATDPEPDLAAIAPWVPPELAAVVSRALTRDLQKRIPDCTTFAKLLSEAMPEAARPRREESLYMEPSDFSERAPARPAGERAPARPAAGTAAPKPISVREPSIEVEPLAARRAPTTVTGAAVQPVPSGAPTRSSRWPLFAVVAVALVAMGLYSARHLLRATSEPAPAAASTPAAEGSASVAASSAAKPKASPAPKPKPKPSVAPSKPSPSVKPSHS